MIKPVIARIGRCDDPTALVAPIMGISPVWTYKDVRTPVNAIAVAMSPDSCNVVYGEEVITHWILTSKSYLLIWESVPLLSRLEYFKKKYDIEWKYRPNVIDVRSMYLSVYNHADNERGHPTLAKLCPNYVWVGEQPNKSANEAMATFSLFLRLQGVIGEKATVDDTCNGASDGVISPGTTT